MATVNRNRAIVFFAWGTDYIQQVVESIRESKLPSYTIFIITDSETQTRGVPANVELVRRDCHLSGKVRKAELLGQVPGEIGTALFLDADTRVIDDVSLGFEK